MLRDLTRHRELVRLEETTGNQRVAFRHDRVRDHLLADAIKDAISRDDLPAEVMSEPYFAEVIGMAIARSGVASKAIDKVVEANPLALFCALRHCSSPQADPAQYLVKASMNWAEGGTCRGPLNESLRGAVLRVLAECDGPHVRGLCETIGQDFHGQWSLRGRFRNGDLYAGVRLCAQLPPGVGWVGHVELIDHVVKKGGCRFILDLKAVLRRRDLTEAGRRGVLRLAGFVASPELAGVLRESWLGDFARKESLSDYFWACSQCAVKTRLACWSLLSTLGRRCLTRTRIISDRLAFTSAPTDFGGRSETECRKMLSATCFSAPTVPNCVGRCW